MDIFSCRSISKGLIRDLVSRIRLYGKVTLQPVNARERNTDVFPRVSRAQVQPYHPRSRAMLHEIVERHYQDFISEYEQRYRETYGGYRFERIDRVVGQFRECDYSSSRPSISTNQHYHASFSFEILDGVVTTSVFFPLFAHKPI